jgi:hypothetical protein
VCAGILSASGGFATLTRAFLCGFETVVIRMSISDMPAVLSVLRVLGMLASGAFESCICSSFPRTAATTATPSATAAAPSAA